MFSAKDRIRRAAIWCLGGWLFLSISMAYVAGSTFATLKPARLRSADQVFAKLDAGSDRPQALRYVASELNRKFFRHYGFAQLALGLIALLLVGLSGHRFATIFTLLAFALALYFTLSLIPQATELGRAIDFTPKEPITDERAAFDKIHGMSTKIEGTKMLLLLASSVFILRQKSES